MSWALTGTALACAGSSSELVDHLSGRSGVGLYDVVFRDRRAGTGSVKIIYNDGGWGPFHLTLSGPMTEGPGLTFSLGAGGGSVRMDWPSGFAAAMGLPEIEYCDALADVINVDVDPN